MTNETKRSKKTSWRWISSIMLSILIAACAAGIVYMHDTKKLLDEKKDIDRAYVSAMDMVSQGLNVDYMKLTEQETMYYFTLLSQGIGGAKHLYKNTSYYTGKAVQNLALAKLQVYMNEQYLSDFQNFEHSQIEIYNLIGNICMDLNSTIALEELYNYLNDI